MRTAEDILTWSLIDKNIEHFDNHPYFKETIIEAMKEYAEQAIDMCASSAMVKTEGITQDDEEGSIHYFSAVDEDSILKVKDLLI